MTQKKIIRSPRKTSKRAQTSKHNYAFIDNENVNISVQRQGRKIDRGKLREWLRERFDVQKAYMFMGYIEKYQPMYDFFESLDYVLIFKPINTAPHIPNKGNVDAEMVLQAMIDIEEYRQAIIMTGDGDFACLVRHLRSKRKLERVIVPNKDRYAELLEEATGKQKIYSLTRMKKKLQYIPGEEPLQSATSSTKQSPTSKKKSPSHQQKEHSSHKTKQSSPPPTKKHKKTAKKDQSVLPKKHRGPKRSKTSRKAKGTAYDDKFYA